MKDKKNNTGVENTGENNSGDGNSGSFNSGDGNSGYGNSGHGNSGYGNSGDWNSGYGNSGYRNSGYGNSTERETGLFNSTSGTLRMFNKPTDKEWDEIEHPHFLGFYLTKWIPENEMTDEEKKNYPYFNLRNGYLKTYTYEEAWKNFWKDTDEDNRNKFLTLPNFDATVFKEITGIDVEDNGKKSELMKKAQELIDKANELKKEAEKL